MARNTAHSVKVRLLNLSDHDNRRYQQLLVRYMQERFLYRLSESKYCDKFILKGGALLYAYDEFLPRPTLDVDFMGANISNNRNAIIAAFKEIVSDIDTDDGVRFVADSIDAYEIAVDRKYPGVRITVTGLLDTIRKELTFDIGFGDIITPSPVIMSYPIIIDGMTSPKLTAYSLETVVAEKFQTMVDKSVFNSRMKDFYDLYRIVRVHDFNAAILARAIQATFENRNTRLSDARIIFSTEYVNDPTLEKRWNSFCEKTRVHNPPTFKEIMDAITDFLRPYLEPLLAMNDAEYKQGRPI